MDLNELVDDFSFFDSWEDRYRYLIELGSRLSPLDPGEKIESNRVRGCISQVWVVPSQTQTLPPRLTFRADSDSAIVKGLVAVAHALLDERTPDEVAAVNVEEVFGKLGFDAHLSVNRRNGFQSMIETLKRHAAAL